MGLERLKVASESQGEAMVVYSLWDRKLREFGALVISRNDESIIRAVCDGIPGSNSMVAKHPEDFDLMRLGEYFPASGFLGGEQGPPVLVANVGDILRAAQHAQG